LLRQEAQATDDPRLGSALLCAAAQVREDELGDAPGAAVLYRKAMSSDPGNQHALQALLRAARASDDFPTMAKLYEALAQVEDSKGEGGDVAWNFEKFLVSPNGDIQRFRTAVAPESSELVQSIEAALPQ